MVSRLRADVAKVPGADHWIEVVAEVVELAQSFRPTALPIDFLRAVPTQSEKATLTRQQFIEQLRVLEISRSTENALVDYYRAFAQRSQWAADHLLIDAELADYEALLCDEWNRVRLYLLDERGEPTTEQAMQELGRRLLQWMEAVADFPLRPDVHHAYVMRGSYHMLADEIAPRVWWHPAFAEEVDSPGSAKKGMIPWKARPREVAKLNQSCVLRNSDSRICLEL